MSSMTFTCCQYNVGSCHDQMALRRAAENERFSLEVIFLSATFIQGHFGCPFFVHVILFSGHSLSVILLTQGQ